MGAHEGLLHPYPENPHEGSPPDPGREGARQEDGPGAPSSRSLPAAPPGPRDLAEWQRRKVADLNARFPGWHCWRDEATGIYHALRRGNHWVGPGEPPEAVSDADVHLLAVHLSVLDEELP